MDAALWESMLHILQVNEGTVDVNRACEQSTELKRMRFSGNVLLHVFHFSHNTVMQSPTQHTSVCSSITEGIWKLWFFFFFK